jgi:hypothetical protein
MQKLKLSPGLLVLAVVMATGTSFASPTPLPPYDLPDVGSSALLMSMALGGLAVVRKYIYK